MKNIFILFVAAVSVSALTAATIFLTIFTTSLKKLFLQKDRS